MNLKLEDFKSWLLTKKADEVVGKTFNCYTCPVANYIKEISGEETVVVGDKKLHLKSGSFNHPEWARKFIDSMDDNQTCITAGKALLQLSYIEYGLV